MKYRPMYILAVLLALAIVGFIVWRSVTTPKPSGQAATSQQQSKCTDELALSLAQKDSLPEPNACYVDTYATNDNQNVKFVYVEYNEQGKNYLLNDKNEVITSYPETYADPDLSLGSTEESCKAQVWTNDPKALALHNKTQYTRSLVYEQNEYRWRIELKNFTGQLEGGTIPPKCSRTGELTTKLDGTDLKVIGTPTFDLR